MRVIYDCIAEFEGDWTKMTCGGCCRFVENAKRPGHWKCCSIHGPDEIEVDTPACQYYWDREEQAQLDAQLREQDERERQARREQNRNNPPRPAIWKRDWDGCRDRWTGYMPFCPNCEEALYDTDRCYFCGQAIEQDERMKQWREPEGLKRMDCFSCGGRDTMVYAESKYNGHKHGRCEKCGASFIE